jgi:anti-anti-sigma factor
MTQGSTPFPSHEMAGDEWQTLAEFAVPSELGNERLAVERVATTVQKLSMSPLDLERLKTAVAEATMNAIEHGNHFRSDWLVSIRVLASRTAVAVTVTDQGGGGRFPEPEVPDLQAKLAGQQSPRGWGLYLIEHLVDEMQVISDGTQNTLELYLYWKEPDPEIRHAEAWELQQLDDVVDQSITNRTRRHIMPQSNITINVRSATDQVGVVDVKGEFTGFAENSLMDAYTQVTSNGVRAIILNFSDLAYMNSSGIGLLVTLLIRANRQGQRLVAYGLNEHYQHIFELTRLNEAIRIFDTEAEALAALA